MKLQGIFLLGLMSLVNSVHRGSLVFVIDDTLSMQPTIDQVKEASLRIMDIIFSKPTMPIEDIVLVTFNDPTFELRVKTKDKNDLEAALNKVKAHNVHNPYCPEYSMSGLELGLQEGRNNSFLFLFTDSAAEDEYKWKAVRNLAQEKQTPVMFIITPSHCNVEIGDDYIYHKIARQTNGQVFHLKSTDEIKDLFKYVDTVIAGDINTLETRVVKPNQRVEVPFSVDEQTEYVVVSASGKDVELSITGPMTEFERVTWLKNAKMLKLNNPMPGDYIATVFGTSSTSVMVFARTDFTFEHGFSAVPATSLSNTDKQPVDGSSYYLIVSVTDPSHSVQIKNLIIRTMDDRNLETLPLKRISGDLYTTELFQIPSRVNMLNIVVEGVGIKTRRPIRRKSRTPVVIRKQDIKPRISVSDTSVEYNKDIVLICHVKAHPAPTITWLDESGRAFPFSQRVPSSQAPPYDYSSGVVLKRVKKTQKIYCKAVNNIGATTLGATVTMESPFNVGGLEDYINETVHYGQSHELVCPIMSLYELEISWYKETSTLENINNSTRYQISNGGRVLAIKSVDRDTKGKYICKATIIDDPNTSHTQIMNVDILKTAPVLEEWPDTIVLRENDSMRLECKVIGGYPRPIVHWQYRDDSEAKYFHGIPGQYGPVLGRHKVRLQSTETSYKCIATNDAGTAELTKKVIVQAPPSITIMNETSKVTTTVIDYNGTLSLTCQATGYPVPEIVWTDNKNNVISSQIERFKESAKSHMQLRNIKRQEKYRCKALNNLGEVSESISVDISLPFKPAKGITVTRNVKYGEPAVLNCPVSSLVPVNTIWYKKHEEGKLTKVEEGPSYRLEKVLLDSQGKYVCKASVVNDDEISSDEFDVDLIIVGLEKPIIEKKINSVTVRENTRAVMHCKVLKGHPKPVFSWEFIDPQSKTVKKLSETSEKLAISQVGLQNAGAYKCIADNGFGKDEHVISLIVMASPKIYMDETRLYTAVEGDMALRLPCNVTGYPKPAITWTKNGDEINPDGKKYIIKKGTLIITEPKENDSNNYTCKAQNELGAADATLNVLVTPFISEHKDRGDKIYKYYLKGDKIQLKCGDGSDTQRVVWYKEDIQLNEVGNTVNIDQADVLDDGNYTCRVSTLDNVVAHTYIVDVGNAPSFTNNMNPQIDWDGDDRTLLRCDVNMKPEIRTVKIKWTYNDDLLNNNVSTSQKIIGWGNYTCKIANIHGVVTKSYYVTSSDCLIKLNKYNANTPLMLNKETKKIAKLNTVRNHFVLSNNDTLQLSCYNQIDKHNSLKNYPTLDKINVICDHEDQFIGEDEEVHHFEDFTCKTPVLPSMKATGEKCLKENTELIKVGFEIEADFIEVYEVCYDNHNDNAIYTRVELSMPVNLAEVTNPDLMPYRNASDKGYYNCSEGASCCYAKAQLVNPQDVTFGPPQTATNFERLNSVPLWRTCAEEEVTWDTIERAIREVLLLEYGTITVWTGASQYQSRDPTSGNPLAQDIPRYLWKVVKASEDEIFAIVYVNDLSPSSKDVLCDGNCLSDIPSSTYTYCCDVTDFCKAFDLPKSTFELVL